MLIQTDVDLVGLLRETSPVAKAVLVILMVFSVWSWGIILSKVLLFRRVTRESNVFWEIFRKRQNLPEISAACETLHFTPLVPVLNSAVEALQPRRALGHSGGSSSVATAVKTAPSVSALQRVLHRTSAAQLTRLERRLTMLATTASVTPFIGLFG